MWNIYKSKQCTSLSKKPRHKSIHHCISFLAVHNFTRKYNFPFTVQMKETYLTSLKHTSYVRFVYNTDVIRNERMLIKVKVLLTV